MVDGDVSAVDAKRAGREGGCCEGVFGDKCAQSTVEVRTQGLCQGNSAAPAGWAVISIAIIGAHKKKGHGAHFLCPISELKTDLVAILYVDDTDIIHLDMSKDDSVADTHAALQASVMSWGNLLIATGGAEAEAGKVFLLPDVL